MLEVGLLGVSLVHIGTSARGSLAPFVQEAVETFVILDLLGWRNVRAILIRVKAGGMHDSVAKVGIHGAIFAGPSCDFVGRGEINRVEVVTTLFHEGPDGSYGLVKFRRILFLEIRFGEEAGSETPVAGILARSIGSVGLLRVGLVPVNINCQVDSNGIEFLNERREKALGFGLGHISKINLALVLESSGRFAIGPKGVDVVPPDTAGSCDLREPGHPDINTLPECRIIDLDVVRCGSWVRNGVGLPIDLPLRDGHWVIGFDNNGSDDAKVTLDLLVSHRKRALMEKLTGSASTNRPEQVLVLKGVGMEEFSVSSDDLKHHKSILLSWRQEVFH